MDIVTKINNDLNELLESNKSLTEKEGDSINIKLFESRENFMNQLNYILNFIPELTSRIESTLHKTTEVHAKELSAMDSLLNKAKKRENVECANSDINDISDISDISDTADSTNDNNWTTIVRKKCSDRNRTDTKSPTRSNHVKYPPKQIEAKAMRESTVPAVSPDKYSRIKFTEALSLPAVKVPTFDYVRSDGELYYVECADHFAFRLGGKLLHGNIGVVYTEEKNPEKIKDCRFASSCMKQDRCDYYHDPFKFPGSRDHRNFIASSFLYSPPNSEYKNRLRSRRFGSREHLDKDIVGLSEEEISRFHDQCMHDLLCSLLLSFSYSQ